MSPNLPFAFAFVAAQLLALPGLALALYLYLVGRVADSGGLLRAFFELMFSGVVVLPFVLLCFVTLGVAGMFAAARPWAALALACANIAIIATAWSLAPPRDGIDLVMWLPAAVSTWLACWLALPVFAATAAAS